MIQLKIPNVCVFESALFRTTSTVIQTPDMVVVIDPTWLPQEVMEIQHFVHTIQNGRPLYLLFTHSDYDHIIAYCAFRQATVIASKALIDNPDRDKNIQQILKFDDEHYIQREYPIEYPVVNVIVDQDEQEFIIGDTRLTFYLAPGHNIDGIFTLIMFDNQRLWVAGDYLSNVEFPFIYHSSLEYENTLTKAEIIINQFRPTILIPGHGDASFEIQEMKTRVEESQAYIQSLRIALQKGNFFEENTLWKRYHFPGIQQKYHIENIELLKRELSMK